MLKYPISLLRPAAALGLAVAILLAVRFAVTQAAAALEDHGAALAATDPRPARPISDTAIYSTYLPLIARDTSTMTEFRGLWVTRFDWTFFGRPVTTTDLDLIVDNAAAAHFNALLFQIRGTADAYYSSTLEPWAARLTGQTTKTLGVDPGWDPLAYLTARAHASGLQVHAYLNVYPTWLCQLGEPPHTTPEHLFWTLSHSTTWNAWRVFDASGQAMLISSCTDYLWATPALSLTRNHVAAVAADIVRRYAVDGLHLDLIRYPGAGYSYDPYTLQAFTAALQITPSLTITAWRPGFQRAQVDALVAQVHAAVISINPEVLVSAAVWPNYADGYAGYYQDSQGWLAGGLIDANLPMLYASDILHDLAAWTDRARGFIEGAHGRWVMPGLSGAYDNFAELADRIAAARSLGAPGVAIFSYGALNARAYWDDLANGPFAVPAVVPRPDWKP